LAVVVNALSGDMSESYFFWAQIVIVEKIFKQKKEGIAV
jgi:hypothetical protein